MTKKIKEILINLVYSALLGLGIIFTISPLFLYWWIHDNYERYLWIISGQEPFNNFGGGPYQLVLYGSLFLIGIIIILIAFIIKKFIKK